MPMQWGADFGPDESADDDSCQFETTPEDIMGYDLRSETAFLELHKKTHEMQHLLVERFKEMDAELRSRGLIDQLNQRIAACYEAAKERMLLATLQRVATITAEGPEKAHAQFREFLNRCDPLILTNALQNATDGLHDSTMRFVSAIEPVAMIQGPEQARDLMRPAFLAGLSAHSQTLLALGEMTLKALDRIAHGMPEWDFENGCEKSETALFTLGSSSSPSSSPSSSSSSSEEASASSKPSESEQELLSRLSRQFFA